MHEAKVLVLGVAFKKDVDDTRHSPAIKIIELLKDIGFVNIAYSDPHVPALKVRGSNWTLDMESVDVNDDSLHNADVCVVCTEHSAFPYSQIAKQSKMVIDTRNAMKNVPHDREKVSLLGGGAF